MSREVRRVKVEMYIERIEFKIGLREPFFADGGGYSWSSSARSFRTVVTLRMVIRR